MVLRNGEMKVSPSYVEVISLPLKSAVKVQDYQTAYSLLLFYVWIKNDEQKFHYSDLTYLMDELQDYIAMSDNTIEDGSHFLRQLELRRNADIENFFSLIHSEVEATIKGLKEFIELNSLEEWPNDHIYHLFQPLYTYIELLKVVLAGIHCFLKGVWEMSPKHIFILQLIDYQKDINFSKIDI